MIQRRAALIPLAISLLTACKSGDCKTDGDCKGDRICSDGACTEPIFPTKGQPGSLPPSGSGAPTNHASRSIAAGMDANGVWTPAYTLREDQADAGLTYLPAYARCASKGLALCTETQWSRACSQDGSLGQTETWTASPSSSEGFVVRGGSTCEARRIVSAADMNTARGAACCDRAVGIRTTNTNEAFLITSAKRMLDYENALRRRDTTALRRLYDDSVRFLSTDFTLDGLIKQTESYFRQYPDQWILYDVCETRIEKGAEVNLVSDCTAVSHRKGDLAVVVQQFVRGGPDTRIQKLTEPRVFRKFSPP